MEYWKKRTIDRLRDYRGQVVAINNLPEQIRALISEAESIKSATTDGTPVRGGGSTREDRMLSNIVLREELKQNLYRTRKYVDCVDRGLAVLDKQERSLIERAYINGERGYAERMVDELGLEDVRSVYKRLDRALYRMTIAMYGVTES